MENLSSKERDEILKRIENGAILEKIQKDPEWEILQDAFRYVRDRAVEGLRTVDPNDKTQILRLQLQADFYDDVLPNIVKQIRTEAEEAYEAAKEHGIVSHVLSYFKARFSSEQ